MKRRFFLKNLGLGTSGIMAAPVLANSNRTSELPPYFYGTPDSLAEIINDEGQVALRVAIKYPEEPRQISLDGKIKVKNGSIDRMRHFQFEPDEDRLIEQTGAFHVQNDSESKDIITMWIKEPQVKTRISIDLPDDKIQFTLGELITEKEVRHQTDDYECIINYLLYKEIGVIDPAEAGIKDAGNNFTFIAMADPQGGDPNDPGDRNTRMKIHNAFIEESVALVNRLEIDPAFTIVIGDVTDAWGFKDDFERMNQYLHQLKTPVLYEIGNHETRLDIDFSPGYNMEGFNNYFAATKDISGIDKLLYSFDLGEWHFIVWPDPLRTNFWENHPHYFDWLERDLEKNKHRPTMFFQHVPAHPVGINPLINYCETVGVKRTLLNILSRHGNVRYDLSGHVHLPVKASVKTAVDFEGIKMINLPAAGFRPRAFGEQDYFGGPSQGVAIVDIKGKEAEITFKTVTDEEFRYPDTLPAFNDKLFKLWLNYKWELPAEQGFINGDFFEDLNGWSRRYVYMEDENPSNICEVRKPEENNGKPALYLYTRRRGYMKPGQDRLPQDINRISQAVSLQPGARPQLSFSYLLDGENCDFDGFNGAYIWVEGYRGSLKVVNMMYSANKVWVNIGGNYGFKKYGLPVMIDLKDSPNKWHDANLNIAEDYNNFNEKDGSYASLKPDKLIVTMGLWNINDGEEQPFAIYFKDFSILQNSNSPSTIDGKPVQKKPKEMEWWRGRWTNVKNVAGEHRYMLATDPKYKVNPK